MTRAADDIVLVAGDVRVARGEFHERIARAVTGLRELGLGGDGGCIGIALRNCPEFFELAAAAAMIGAKSVPIAWRLKHEEVRYLVENSGARAVFYDSGSAAQMVGLPGISLDEYEARRNAAEPAAGIAEAPLHFNMQLYSSGTTGRPKAIDRGQPTPEQLARLQSGAFNMPAVMGVAGPDEVHMVSGPLYHSQPIGFSTQALMAGQRVVMMPGSFDAETCLATIEREKVTWMTCVPTHFIRILALPEQVRDRYDLSSLKAVMHSAAPCPRDIKAAMMEFLPGDVVWEVYGGTEGAMSMISPQEARVKLGSVGRAFPPGTELTILDDEGNPLPAGVPGLIYGQPMMSFTYRGADETNREIWRGELFTLGDVGYLDEDGYLFITDRQKDMIISGGANIYPAEVEAVLFNHSAVGDVSIIGVPDAQWGEKVKAIVELRAAATADEIIAFCRSNLAHYKCPTSIDFVHKLPRDPNGKVRKRDLREAYWADAGRSV